MKCFFKVILVALLCFSINGFSQLKKENYKTNKTYQIPKWEVLDISFTNNVDVKSPYTAKFKAVFTHENGFIQEVPGFYNGNNEWIIRFSSSLEGQWRFETKADVNKLSGKKGKVTVTEAKENNHGAVTVNKEDPQHFYYEDGTPYFLLAFECDWLYALDYHNDKNLPKTEHLLNLIEESGFNQVVMNVFSYDVSWKKDEKLKDHPEHEFGGPKNIFPFLGNNEKPDYSALNPEFFQKLDRTISLMHDKRIVSHLMIYVWNKLVAWPDMNTEADNMYFDYVVKRYQAFPNVIWDISKEALFYGRADEAYIHGRIERVRANDEFNRLLSVHDFKYCSRFPEKVDFISTQNWVHDIYNKMLDARNKFKDKPVFNIEHGGYEGSPYKVFTGDYTNAETCLRRNYMCLFAGVYTTYYWQGASWNVIIYNPFEQPESFIKPKFEYFEHMQKLFTQFNFSKMKPTPWKNGSAYNLTDDNETVLLYIHKENYGIDAAFLRKEHNNRTVQWFNTLTGEFSDIEAVSKNGKFISPWQGKADSIIISRLK
ncbi:DUF5060 domain-containing protein [Algibacter lectus]|uniref:Uncharacterized protein DUF5060 n=1 Tax=Algibacter lectus TaxID=221126 RepID=A0A4R8MI71_9FLAO|nr:DUF5060 domain-containing protein [Algibacter lectus]MWW25278.1 DUF4038 domain-containing protein [Algibacter lectus]TDY64307.1 uncharacterized protein DUF5060 [Algibacter lectus]